jgi:cephalosporin hydroxylase
MPHKFNEIEGFFDFPHLYERMVKEASDGDSFIEIGSWKGRSACYMAELIKESGKKITLYCIDTWTGDVFGEGNLGQSYHIFSGNLTGQGFKINKDYKDAQKNYDSDITAIVLDSLSAAELFKDESCQFIFLDGAHGYENVKKEIELYVPKLKKGGYLGGHDYPDPNIERAVREGLTNVESITNYFESNINASFLWRKPNE